MTPKRLTAWPYITPPADGPALRLPSDISLPMAMWVCTSAKPSAGWFTSPLKVSPVTASGISGYSAQPIAGSNCNAAGVSPSTNCPPSPTARLPSRVEALSTSPASSKVQSEPSSGADWGTTATAPPLAVSSIWSGV